MKLEIDNELKILDAKTEFYFNKLAEFRAVDPLAKYEAQAIRRGDFKKHCRTYGVSINDFEETVAFLKKKIKYFYYKKS